LDLRRSGLTITVTSAAASRTVDSDIAISTLHWWPGSWTGPESAYIKLSVHDELDTGSIQTSNRYPAQWDKLMCCCIPQGHQHQDACESLREHVRPVSGGYDRYGGHGVLLLVNSDSLRSEVIHNHCWSHRMSGAACAVAKALDSHLACKCRR
jgi:hypothetical protein